MGNELSKPTNKSYTWTVSFDNSYASMICNGYAHIHGIMNYPQEVMEILIQYVDDSINLESFQNSPTCYVIASRLIFTINKHHKFSMEIWPNGDVPNAKTPPLIFKFYYISSPPYITQMHIKCKLKLPFIEQALDLDEYLQMDLGMFLQGRLNFSDPNWKKQIESDEILQFTVSPLELQTYNKIVYDRTQQKLLENAAEYLVPDPTSTDPIIEPDANTKSGEFVWGLSPFNRIFELHGNRIRSFPFERCGLKLLLIMYKPLADRDAVAIYLRILSLSPNIAKMVIKYRIGLYKDNPNKEEDDIYITDKENWTIFMPAERPNNTKAIDLVAWDLGLLPEEKQMFGADKEDFLGKLSLDLKIIDVFDTRGQSALDRYERWSCLMGDKQEFRFLYLWKITNVLEPKISISECIEAVGCVWRLRSFINADNETNEKYLYIQFKLVSLPPGITSVDVVYNIHLLVGDKQQYKVPQVQFKNGLYDSIPISVISEADLNGMNNVEWVFQVIIIDLWGKNGYAITDRYLKSERNIEQRRLEETKEGCDVKDETKFKELNVCGTGEYIWNVDKDASVTWVGDYNKAYSPIFEAVGMKWYISLDVVSQNMIMVRLVVASFSPKLRQAVVGANAVVSGAGLEIKESNVVTIDSDFGIAEIKMNIPDDVDIEKVESLEVKTNIDLLRIIGENYDEIKVKDIKSISIMNGITSPNRACFKWEVGEEMIEKYVNNGDKSSYFDGPLMDIYGFKFMLRVFPNGKLAKDQFKFGMRLISMPLNVDTVWGYWEVTLIETKTNNAISIPFSRNACEFSMGHNPIKTLTVQNMNKLTFILKTQIVDVFDENIEWITNLFIEDSKENDEEKGFKFGEFTETKVMDEFIWNISDKKRVNKIKDIKCGESVSSVIFGDNDFKWTVHIYPNGGKEIHRNRCYVGLQLNELPENVSGLSVLFDIFIEKIGVKKMNCNANFIESDLMKLVNLSIKTDKFINHQMDKLTISVRICLVDVFDNNCVNITNKYI